jgi:hypothetical protein
MSIPCTAERAIDYLAKLKTICSKKDFQSLTKSPHPLGSLTTLGFPRDNSEFWLDFQNHSHQSSLGFTTRLCETSTLPNLSSLRGRLPSANRK